MAQNADNQDDKSSGNDDLATKVTADDLRKDFYGEEDVENADDESSEDETSDEQDESEDDSDKDTGDEDGKTDDETEEDDSEEEDKTDSDDDDSEFVKEFPNIKGDTLVDYTRNLEQTVSFSNKEGKRLADENALLRQQVEDLKAGKKGTDDSSKGDDKSDDDNLTPEQAFFRRKMNEEIDAGFKELRKGYAKYIDDPAEYEKFVKEVRTQGAAARLSGNPYVSPMELYAKSVAILGWERDDTVDSKDRLKVALKDKAAVTKTSSSSTGKKAPKSKVTDRMLRLNRAMYPNKTDDEIRKELEPYVQ